MKTKLVLACASLVALLPATGLAVPTVYSYTGPFYTEIDDPALPPGTYTNSMRVTGSLTLDEAIAPDSEANVNVGNPSVLAFSFNDGRFDYTKANQVTGHGIVVLRTNASGNIASWHIFAGLVAPAPGIGSANVRTVGPGCLLGGPCDTGFVVDNLNPANIDRGETFVAGSWTITAVPEPETYALFLAGIGLVGFAAHRRSKLPT